MFLSPFRSKVRPQLPPAPVSPSPVCPLSAATARSVPPSLGLESNLGVSHPVFRFKPGSPGSHHYSHRLDALDSFLCLCLMSPLTPLSKVYSSTAFHYQGFFSPTELRNYTQFLLGAVNEELKEPEDTLHSGGGKDKEAIWEHQSEEEVANTGQAGLRKAALESGGGGMEGPHLKGELYS